MRFTQAATDFYKNVRKEAEATGAIPKPKPKPKPKTQRNVAEFELDGEKFVIEWDGVGDDADVARVVNGVKAQVAGGANVGAKFGATQIPTPKPQPKTTGIGPQFPAQRGAEIGAMGAGASRAVSVEEINARELQNTPTEKLVEELLRGPNQKTSAKQERYRAVLDELQNRATTAGKNTPLGPLMGPMGALNIDGLTNAGHLAGLVSGGLLEPFETGASLGKASSGADLDIRDRINIIGATPQTGAALGAIGKVALEKGGELAARRAAKTGITPPVPKTGTKAALPREVPPMRVVEPAQMPGFTGTTRRSVLEPKAPSVLDEVLGPPAAKPAVEPMPAPVAMAETSPVRGSVGETVPRIGATTAATGKPMTARVFHGSGAIFDEFDFSKAGANDHGFFGKGAYFFDDEEWARGFAEVYGKDGTPTVYTAEISLNNPLVYNGAALGPEDAAQLQRRAQEAGHDGIVIPSRAGGPAEFVVFNKDAIHGFRKTDGTPIPTTSRYGANYGTPQPGQGQRVGYPRSVLDEVLGEPTPKPDANRAKEPWEMTRDEWGRSTKTAVRYAADYPNKGGQPHEVFHGSRAPINWEARPAFVTLDRQFAEVYAGDLAGAVKGGEPHLFEGVALTENPLVIAFPTSGNGTRQEFTDALAKALGARLQVRGPQKGFAHEFVNANLDDLVRAAKARGFDSIQFNDRTYGASGRSLLVFDAKKQLGGTHRTAIEQALREGKPVPAEVLADYPDLAAKYGKTAEQNPPVKPPASPAETPQPATATVDPEKLQEVLDVIAAQDRARGTTVVKKFWLKGTDGKWHKENGFPFGVTSTGEKKPYWVWDEGGRSYKSFDSEEAATKALEQRTQAKVNQMRDAVNEDPSMFAEQYKFFTGKDYIPPAQPSKVDAPAAPAAKPAKVPDGFVSEKDFTDWPAEARLPSASLDAKRGLQVGDDATLVVSRDADGKASRIPVRIADVGSYDGEPAALVVKADGSTEVVKWIHFDELRRADYDTPEPPAQAVTPERRRTMAEVERENALIEARPDLKQFIDEGNRIESDALDAARQHSEKISDLKKQLKQLQDLGKDRTTDVSGMGPKKSKAYLAENERILAEYNRVKSEIERLESSVPDDSMRHESSVRKAVVAFELDTAPVIVNGTEGAIAKIKARLNALGYDVAHVPPQLGEDAVVITGKRGEVSGNQRLPAREGSAATVAQSSPAVDVGYSPAAGVESNAGVAKPGPQAGTEAGRSGHLSPNLGEIKRADATPNNPTTPTSARQATGLANVVQDAEADAGMIASSPRATGTKRGEAQAKGKAAVESGEIDPETLAAEIASGKRTFKDETEVGALMEGKRRLLQQADDIGKKIDEAHARGEDATDLIAQREAVRTRLNTLIENVQVGKGKWSDVGRSLQEGTTIDEGNFENVLAEFRRNKPDGKVSEREAKALQDLVDQHNATKEQLAKVESELAQLKAAEGAQIIARKGTVGRRTVTQIRAERDLVAASISKSIREAIGGPIGFGGGGLENLFEVVPQLARDLRKLIELYIEEFKVGKLDSEFYVGAKQVIRDALADVPDEVLDDLKVDLKNLSDDEVNRIFGGIYDVKQSRTKSEVQARISDLKKQAELLAKIEGAKEGEVLKAGTPPPPASPTVRELRAQLNELLKGLGADPSMDGVRTRLNNILDDLNKQSQGKYRNIKDNKTRVSPPDIQRIREQIASVRRDMRLEDTLADLEEQLATGNYKTPNKRVASLTAEQEKLKARVDMRRAEVRRAIDNARPKTLTDKAITVANLPRTVRASVDLSAPGRQGWILGIANPKAAYKAFGDQMRALMTEEGLIRAQNSITERPNAPLYKKADLYLAPVDGAVNLKEEAFMGADALRRWKKFNPVRASDRAYAAYLNRLRADVFDKMVGALGQDATDAELRDIARYINVASGRGDIGLKGASDAGKSVANAMPALAMGFWSPRNLASRVQFVTGVPLAQAGKNKATRKLIAREYAKSIVATGALIGTAKLALESQQAKDAGIDGGVSLDITNSDFGKVRIGDTRIDMMAGAQQVAVLIGRLITGKATAPTSGKVTDLTSAYKAGPWDQIMQFLKYKRNPVLSSAEEFYTGKNAVGADVSKGKAVANMFVPLSVMELYEGLTDEGVDKEDALILLNFFGISTSRFKDKEKKADPR